MQDSVQTRWVSFENPTGAPGRGGMENKGAKGHAFETVRPGASVTLADIRGSGIVRRLWMTVNRRAPHELRALRLQMYWDGEPKPAVDAPLADFFGAGLGRLVPFENALFASPEGRSFNSYIPMPFRTAARVVFTNEGAENVDVFYDLNYELSAQPADMLYFHAYWSREQASVLGRDFEMLPRVEGRGRYLGVNIGVITDPQYENTWWGEGEVKVYLDADADLPTLVGSGTEDYVGTGWGQGAYVGRFQGSLVAAEQERQWTFYRYHIPDPVFFHAGCRVTLQQIGGGPTDHVAALLKRGVRLTPVTIDPGGRHIFQKFLEITPPPDVTAPDFPKGWVNFYRSDDVSATAYFYLDRPSSGLPELPPAAARTAALTPPPQP